jgi:hypothetical protein
MKTKLKQLVFALSVLAVVALAPAIVKADPVLFALQDSVMVSAGGSATLTGSISNGGPPRVWLTSWTFTFSDPLLSANDAALSSLPFFLDSMQSYGPAAFFDVVAAAGLAPGLYTGSISIFGGDNEGDEDVDYTQQFTINVVGGQNPIPEPTTMLLLGSGLAGAAALRRRRRQAKP